MSFKIEEYVVRKRTGDMERKMLITWITKSTYVMYQQLPPHYIPSTLFQKAITLIQFTTISDRVPLLTTVISCQDNQ